MLVRLSCKSNSGTDVWVVLESVFLVLESDKYLCNPVHFYQQDMNEFKVNALQKALDDSVPGSELDKANKEFTNLTEKYRDLLEKGNTLVEKTEQYSGFEVQSSHESVS